MTLAVLGSESLDDLQATVEEIFTKIPDKNATSSSWQESPYGPDEVQHIVEIVPVGDERKIQILFPVEYVRESYKNSVST